MEPPRLPWEVIERVIERSDGHAATLRSFSLTCRQLLPRSRCVLFTRVKLDTKEQVFEFVDFLQDRPHMKALVRSIAVELTDFPPFPLLHLLSNLSEIRFSRRLTNNAIPALHQSTLTCLQRFGTRVRTLHISNIRFATYLPFARLLLAFPSIEHLSWEEVTIEKPGDVSPLEVIRRHLSRQMRLKSLTIDSGHIEFGLNHGASILAFLSDTEWGPFMVERLRIVIPPLNLSKISHSFRWSSLRALVVCVPKVLYRVANAARFLENLQGPMLRDVLVELGPLSSPQSLVLDSVIPEYKNMERALLRFSQPRLLVIIDRSLYANMHAFWTRMVAKNFPVLSERGALTVKSNTVSSAAGHDDTILALAVSPNSKWVASASADTTIVLWNTNDGSVAQQWVAHHGEAVWSLAFSPDSSKLLSGSEDGATLSWNLESGPPLRMLRTTSKDRSGRPVSSCAWSPDGSAVAILSSGSLSTLTLRSDTMLGLRHLCDLEAGHARCVAFSPDGRWLVSKTAHCRYRIWDVAARTLHKEMQHEQRGSDRYGKECLELQVPPVFDPGSKRLATVWGGAGGRFDVWDVETGEGLFGFEDEHMINAISFSPDGTTLLTGLYDGTVRLWDACMGIQLSVLRGSSRWLSTARFSPCGKYIAAVSYGGVVVVWRVSDRSCVATFEPSEDQASESAVPDYAAGLAFAPDGKKLVVFGSNTDCRVIIRVISDVFV